MATPAECTATSQPLTAEASRHALTLAIPQMRAFARSLTGDNASADDLTRDALMCAWRERARFRDGANFRIWVFTILRSQFRSGHGRNPSVRDEERADRVSARPETVNGAMRGDEMHRALRALPVDEREAIILVSAAGFTHAEAAEICRSETNAMKSRVRQARRRLKQILEAGQ